MERLERKAVISSCLVIEPFVRILDPVWATRLNTCDPGRLVCATYNAAGISSITLLSLPKDAVSGAAGLISNIRSKGDPVSAIPGTQLVGEIYEVDNLRFANHAIEGLLIDMRRRAEGRKAGWLRDLFDD